ncbi:hypothetical protein BDF19DRAFT_444963 [Syncephalis fuscata]|nr:hypothetical protein BDF19DRAFT_444963 [Syncephalis fuscata]
MVVGPKLGIPLYNYMLQYHFGRQDAKLKFLELIEIIRDMKAKGWAMYDTIRYGELNV